MHRTAPIIHQLLKALALPRADHHNFDARVFLMLEAETSRSAWIIPHQPRASDPKIHLPPRASTHQIHEPAASSNTPLEVNKPRMNQ